MEVDFQSPSFPWVCLYYQPVSQSRDQTNGPWERGICRGIPKLAIHFCVGCHVSIGQPENASWSPAFVWRTVHHTLQLGKKVHGHSFRLAPYLTTDHWHRARGRNQSYEMGGKLKTDQSWESTWSCGKESEPKQKERRGRNQDSRGERASEDNPKAHIGWRLDHPWVRAIGGNQRPHVELTIQK